MNAHGSPCPTQAQEEPCAPIPKWVVTLRWIGRFWAVFLVLAWFAFLSGPDGTDGLASISEKPVLGTAMLFIFAGLLLGWRFELAGAMLILAGMAGAGAALGQVPAWPFLLPLVSAAAYLTWWWVWGGWDHPHATTSEPPASNRTNTGNPATG